MSDVRSAWIRKVLEGAEIDLVALDEVQASLVDSAAASGTVEVDDARLVAATDVLAAMALLEPGEPQVAWVRGRLVADLGRYDEAAADNLHVVRRCDALLADGAAAPRQAEDLALWRDSALGAAAMAYARGAQPLASAVLASQVLDADLRDDVEQLLEAWDPTADSRVDHVKSLLAGAPVELDDLRYLQVAAARLALDGDTHAADAVLDVLAALTFLEPGEPAHPWNRGALLFELDRPLAAAADKLLAAERMEAAGEHPDDISRARFHASLGFLLGDHPMASAVVASRLPQGGHRDEAYRLMEDWLSA